MFRPSGLQNKNKQESIERALNWAHSLIQKDGLPDDEELAMVAGLREKFKDRLEKRKEEGTHWEFFFGDINMTRIIRGNENDLEQAEKWFTRFLKLFEDSNFDTLTQDVLQRMNEKGMPEARLTFDILPSAEDFQQYCPSRVPQGNRLALNGDVIGFLAFCDFDKRKLLAHGAWEDWVTLCIAQNIAMQIVVDHQSRAQGRMVKVVEVWDMKHCTLGQAIFEPFDSQFDEDVVKVWQATGAEFVRKIFFVNSPWWVSKLWNVATKWMPTKFSSKIAVINADGCQDPEVEQFLNESLLRECFASRVGTAGGHALEPVGTVDIQAGKEFEFTIPIKEGQTVSWTFRVEQNSGDIALGTSNVSFSAVAWWMSDEGEVIAEEAGEDEEDGGEVVVPQAIVTADDKEVDGEIEVTQDGIFNLRWDNYHNKVRGSTIWYQVTVVGGDD
eukprot:gnl/TRDRNA2_/TRDRNA2_197805_c0_seq1.p1 gnl/TRDRNA2_/TRDRNA2_197805_c0~~gnl/TRDRNA2_/TRDRNA2_197805_c0_seq1.p1  ORF type:complete len:442 (+),score=101.50 gnl/TRDRNA2_/TRDRNA2_197805_c0_seq1:156-1481(+)